MIKHSVPLYSENGLSANGAGRPFHRNWNGRRRGELSLQKTGQSCKGSTGLKAEAGSQWNAGLNEIAPKIGFRANQIEKNDQLFDQLCRENLPGENSPPVSRIP
jgi:hypothetical protein